MKINGEEVNVRLFSSYKTKLDVDFHIWKEEIATFHGHDYFEFAICDHGEFFHYKNGLTPELVQEKQAIFITPRDYHSIETKREGSSHINISISQNFFNEICRMYGFYRSDFFKNKVITLKDDEFDYLNKLIGDFMQINSRNNYSLYKGCLYHLAIETFFCFFKRESKIRSNDDLEPPMWLRDFLDKVCNEEHFDMKLAEVYGLCKFSQPVLAQAMQKYYNETFQQYFIKEKIAYARGLLENTNFGTLEISMRIGIYSLSHFNYIFKKHVGMTPTEYRKMNKKQ